jgi:hypothetical protein
MAQQTGIAHIDELIEQFKASTYTSSAVVRPVSDLREHSEDECCYAADAFTCFLVARGVEAYDTVEHLHPDGEYPTIGDIEMFGYEDHPNPSPRFFAHAATYVPVGEITYLIDFAAGQFGYSEWPMVQRAGYGPWQREWVEASSAAS